MDCEAICKLGLKAKVGDASDIVITSVTNIFTDFDTHSVPHG